MTRRAIDLADEVVEADAVVVGTGVAGLTAALGLSPLRVALLTKGELRSGSSTWAQGGVAAAVGDDDSPGVHAADTLAASGGLGEADVVDLLTRDGPHQVARLIELGARFDRTSDGAFRLGREGAHSRRRILHAGGDATGAEMVRALIEAVRRTNGVEVFEHTLAHDLALADGRVAGLLARRSDGRRVLILAPAVVLATGGIGQLYLYTTNPTEVTGDGHAMAARAGARLVDMEFVQFHPTALDVATASASDSSPGSGAHAAALNAPAPLLTEALRGEGAVLLDGAGRRFMPDEHRLAELAPRDVVARAIWRRKSEGQTVCLDAREAVGARFPERFPTVFAACRRHGIDPRREPMPVSPAAHYHMGGIAVNVHGRSSLDGLWACGEASSTGVHGANRLASNSLLEALVFGARVAEDVRRSRPSTPRRADVVIPGRPSIARPLADPGAANGNGHAAARRLVASSDMRLAVRRLMWEKVGLVRSGLGLAAAVSRLERLALQAPADDIELRNLLTVGRLVAAAALARNESRGAHYRTDFPVADEHWERRLYVALAPETGYVSVAIEAPRPHSARTVPARDAA